MYLPRFQRYRFGLWLLLFGLLFACGMAQVYRTGAFGGSFDGDPDEAAHFVTGLMVRDYLLHGWPSPPMAFAERFYLSYPKVSFGVWPPLYHVAEGLWLAAWGATRHAALAFSIVSMAAASVLLFAVSRRELGRRMALLAALFFAALPAVAGACANVMADALCVPLCLGAAWSFARFLRDGRLRDSVAFGAWSAAAILTKYNCGALALLPLVAVPLAGRGDLFRNWRLWAAPVVVLVIAGPWYALNWRSMLYAADMGTAATPTIEAAARANLRLLGEAVGWPAVLLAIAGFRSTWRDAASRPMAASMAGLASGLFLLHTVLYPIAASRYLLPAAAALVVFAAAGWRALPVAPAVRLAAGSVALLAVFAGWPPENRASTAWRAAAERLSGAPILLVSAGAPGEGALVAEVAVRDRRPGQVVLRSSKMLAHATWMNAGYRLLFGSTGDLRRALDAWRVAAIVVDTEMANPLPHHRQLHALLSSAEGADWAREAGDAGRLRVYHRVTSFREPARAISVDLSDTLGRHVTLGGLRAPLPAPIYSVR